MTILHLAQVAFGAYNVYLASITISKLQQYEAKSEKAAEYSSTAAKQLHKTRTTQASGTGAVSLFPPSHSPVTCSQPHGLHIRLLP